MYLFQSSDNAFNNVMEEARTLLLNGDIQGTTEKLIEAMNIKPSPALRQFVVIQELVARLPLNTMNEFYSEHTQFFSQCKKFADMDIDISYDNHQGHVKK